METFLPKGFKIPSKSEQFMTLEQGENKIRVVSPASFGYLLFGVDGQTVKPFRKEGMDDFTMEEILDINPKPNKDGTVQSSKFFMIFCVWNYREKRFQALEITQKGIMKKIQKYLEDEDYGNPMEYDLKINKSGDGLNTEYDVIASPPRKPALEIVEAHKTLNYNPKAVFDGKYPFD